ncbi:type II toxin-antitoxin system VapC family toxin [Candidatus Woesearchaeota archaeon]|nr:type II toxin-antitoxin system VapC family toxin [Candidatus Woesearchaeota archaeon]
MEQKKSENGEKEEQVRNRVIDSSVVIKWFSEEESTEKALKIREDFIKGKNIIAVPDIQIYEIANALRYNKKLSKEEVINYTKSLIDIGIIIMIPTEDTIRSAVETAFQHDITIYDAYFVSLAKELDFDFITADEKFYRKIEKLKSINLLKNLRI